MNTSRRDYPARPLVGIGVVVLRPDADGVRSLMIRRGQPPALGAWSLPGGAQRLGETMEQAARRELMEETGLSVDALHLAAVVDSIHHDVDGRVQYHYTIIDFAALWRQGQACAGGDATQLRWAAEAEWDELALWTEARRAIAAARALLKV